MKKIRIIKTPAGLAPLEMREPWVGREILKDEMAIEILMKTAGNWSGKSDADDYLVLTSDAVLALQNAGENTIAKFWDECSGRIMKFPINACELIEE